MHQHKGQQKQMSAYRLDEFYGIGAVSLHADTPRVLVDMQPSMFLKLAHHMDSKGESAARTIAWIRARLQLRGIGYPILYIAPPLAWRTGDFSEHCRVIESNGRHRVNAIADVQGDTSIPVLLVPWQNITQQELNTWLTRMCQQMISQDGDAITGPFWDTNHAS